MRLTHNTSLNKNKNPLTEPALNTSPNQPKTPPMEPAPSTFLNRKKSPAMAPAHNMFQNKHRTRITGATPSTSLSKSNRNPILDMTTTMIMTTITILATNQTNLISKEAVEAGLEVRDEAEEVESIKTTMDKDEMTRAVEAIIRRTMMKGIIIRARRRTQAVSIRKKGITTSRLRASLRSRSISRTNMYQTRTWSTRNLLRV
mmetsp:Transcript_83262/g.97301  ORF Transcript_83262/g.97301 Transcript_83262/m.97301 type:complete len:202 (-) Transcript_83262:284-889(-)